MKFVKRDIVLLIASVFFIVGLMPFMSPIFAIGIGTAIFFAIKTFVTQRKKDMQKHIGEGFCAECGEKIQSGKCPNCDGPKNPK